MTQIEKNKAELWEGIQEIADAPINSVSASRLVDYMEVYDALCRVSCVRHKKETGEEGEPDTPHFDRKMAMAWASGMINADGTTGPHWTMEQTSKVREDHKVGCDPVLWWVVMNSLYSDYCEALKKNNASTLETYACLAKAWIEDHDAVPNKAAAYFTYVVKH